MAKLNLTGVSKRFPGAGAASVSDLSLDLAGGEFLAVLGPSGCGKTTLLRLIAGLERPSAGTIRLDGRIVSGPGAFVPPEARRIGIVFQGFALWPHLDVAGNVGYPLAARGVRGAARADAVSAALAAVGLEGFGRRAPASLSGGQRQRVALARCLAMAPDLVLFDEPLASLDPHLKTSLLGEIADFRRRTGAAMLYITHDQAEAMALADRIAVMQAGRVQQIAGPETLYREPATPFVAGFVGAGTVLLVMVEQADAAGVTVALGGTRFRARAAGGCRPGAALLCIRPENVRLDPNGLLARVGQATYAGGHWRLSIDIEAAPGQPVPMDLPPGRMPPAGPVSIAIEDAWVVPAG